VCESVCVCVTGEHPEVRLVRGAHDGSRQRGGEVSNLFFVCEAFFFSPPNHPSSENRV